MSLNPEAMDEGAGMRWQLAGSWWMCLLGAFGDLACAAGVVVGPDGEAERCHVAWTKETGA